MEKIHDFPRRQRSSHGVDGEVAPYQVSLQIGAEFHRGFAGIGDVHFGAVGRYLVNSAVFAGADGAVFFADIPDMLSPSAQNPLALGGSGVRGHIEIGKLAGGIA